MNLIKEYDSMFLQIYRDTNLTSKSKIKKNKNSYEYIYRYNNDLNHIHIYKSNIFPHNLLTITNGFMFISKTTDLPILPDFPLKDYKTNITCLSNAFINQKINVAIQLRPSYECNPKCVNDCIIGFDIPENDKDIENFNFESNKIVEKFKSIQEKFKNTNEWKKYIIDNCPSNIHFCKKINDETFKKDVTENDIAYDYDIHSIKEIEIIKKIEETFEDFNQIIKIYDNYNNIVDKIETACKKLKIKYTSSEEVKLKNVKYNGKEKNGRDFGIKWIEISYKDLLKCGLKYSLTDFLS